MMKELASTGRTVCRCGASREGTAEGEREREKERGNQEGEFCG